MARFWRGDAGMDAALLHAIGTVHPATSDSSCISVEEAEEPLVLRCRVEAAGRIRPVPCPCLGVVGQCKVVLTAISRSPVISFHASSHCERMLLVTIRDCQQLTINGRAVSDTFFERRGRIYFPVRRFPDNTVCLAGYGQHAAREQHEYLKHRFHGEDGFS